MKQNPDSESGWKKLVARARQDSGPPIDTTALLRVVRQATPARDEGWAAEFFAVFATGRILTSCFAGACAVAALASWQAWETWQILPWAQWMATATGGVP